MMDLVNHQSDRKNLLADIAEMYFLEGKNQAEIARLVGVTRSNISRMLTEARNLGIIQIQINRPLKEDATLAQKLVERFKLLNARVVVVEQSSHLLEKLGKIGGKELVQHLKPNQILGTSWGTAVSRTVEEIELTTPIEGIKIAQLLGAFGAQIKDYDAHAIVRRLEEKLDADGIYINAPFLVDNRQMAQSLLSNKSIKESLHFGKQADLALLGVGSSDPDHCSYYLAGYVSRQEIVEIQQSGAIGDVCGRFYDIDGNLTAQHFQNKLIGINANDLKNIPIRIGVAGGPAKINPIIGALRGGFINVLVSDSATVQEVLKETN